MLNISETLVDCYVLASDHIGREVIDGAISGFVKKILYADDFEYRLSDKRFY